MTPDAIWRAITDGDETVRYYYGTRVASDWTPGATVTYTYEDGSIAATGQIIAIDAPRSLTMTFHARWDKAIAAEPPVTMTWAIEAGAEGDGACRLTVTTEGFEAGSRVEADFGGGIVHTPYRASRRCSRLANRCWRADAATLPQVARPRHARRAARKTHSGAARSSISQVAGRARARPPVG